LPQTISAVLQTGQVELLSALMIKGDVTIGSIP
jgi:hypothetical protein